MRIIAFAASSSTQSINKQLVTYAAGVAQELIENANVEVLDLNDYALPLFSEDLEKELGQPEPAKRFFQKIVEADAIFISFAEHNGSYTAAYKNLFDWVSRIGRPVYQNKPTLMLATSPGGRGGAGVLAAATHNAPYMGADLKGSLSVPSFFDNFDQDAGELINPELNKQLHAAIASLVIEVTK